MADMSVYRVYNPNPRRTDVRDRLPVDGVLLHDRDEELPDEMADRSGPGAAACRLGKMNKLSGEPMRTTMNKLFTRRFHTYK